MSTPKIQKSIFDFEETNVLLEQNAVAATVGGLGLSAAYYIGKKSTIPALTLPGKVASTVASSPEAMIAAAGATIIAKKITTDIVKKSVKDKLFNRDKDELYNRIKPTPAELAASDTSNSSNKIQIKPEGIIIEDTYNNLIFPMPEPKLDNSKFNLPLIKYHYKNIYTKGIVDFLPWHYCIEIIEGQYYIFNTRPLDMKYPINTNKALELINSNNLKLKKSDNSFFKTKPFDISDAIHVCIIGDTNTDVYIDKIYELIGRLCSGPILRYWKLPTNINQRVIDLNIGSKFILKKLDLYLKK